MKIAIVSRHDPTNVSAWSGTPYFIMREVKKLSGDVVAVRAKKLTWLLLLTRALQRVIRIFGISVDLSTTHAYSRAVGRVIQRELEAINPDVIVGIAASPELANIHTKVPILHISDATYTIMTDYYPEVSRVPRWLWEQANAIEKQVIDKARYSIFPSQWAMTSARDDYGAASEKLRLIRLGGNVGLLPTLDEAYFDNKFSGRCNILFMGKDWSRKGGEIILSAFQDLQGRGLDAHLYIVGCDPFKGNPPSGVTVYTHIRKSDPAEFDLYNRLFSDAALFVLPTRAEAYGLVFAEAAAFATPVIAPDTGGIPSVVDDGRTGVLLPHSAGGREYADAIAALWEDKGRLREMAGHGREKYATDLNWDRWRSDFDGLLQSLQDNKMTDQAEPRVRSAK
ncbi:MAG: hypothetical protein CMN55_08670 [Sneathiella sp.]|jgi:glycosyltransferase involved in cell wall biosynthesis|nr:hypothetical protein [Sneathiella sp.]